MPSKSSEPGSAKNDIYSTPSEKLEYLHTHSLPGHSKHEYVNKDGHYQRPIANNYSQNQRIDDGGYVDIEEEKNDDYDDVVNKTGFLTHCVILLKIKANKAFILASVALILSLTSLIISAGSAKEVPNKLEIGMPTQTELMETQHPLNERRDCSDVSRAGFNKSGIYSITVRGRVIDVYCDLENDGGSWTVIQRRVNGSVDFFKTWKEYQLGFGFLNDEFWIGLDTMNFLTTSATYELLVNLEDWEGKIENASYGIFSVDSEDTNYILTIGDHTGTAGDSLKTHNGQAFTTKDRNNQAEGENCAIRYQGAWWYTNCHDSNLNGIYFRNGAIQENGIVWFYMNRTNESLKRVEMKIRSVATI